MDLKCLNVFQRSCRIIEKREDMTLDPYLTPIEFAKLLKVTPNHIRRLIKQGMIQAIRFGSEKKALYRIPSTELDRIMVMNFEETRKSLKNIKE